jgi:hypothetical protein
LLLGRATWHVSSLLGLRGLLLLLLLLGHGRRGLLALLCPALRVLLQLHRHEQ